MRRLISCGVCLATLAVMAAAQYIPSPGSPPGLEVRKFMWVEGGLLGGRCGDCAGLTQAVVDYRWRNRKYKYVATAEVLNRGTKAIKGLELEFVFSDAATGRERLRYRLSSDEKIRPGQGKEIRRYVRDVRAEGNNYSPANPSQELLSLTAAPAKLMVTRVEYADGSVWQRP